MIAVKITTDFAKLANRLNDFGRKQLPFAISRALTDTAKAARDKLTQDLPGIFDRPTPFTRNAIAYTAARKDNLTALVLVKDVQGGYLLLEETGGTRRPTKGRRALVLPGKALPLNVYGNMSRNKLAQLRAQAQKHGKRNSGIVYLPANNKGAQKRGGAGYFRRLPGGGLQRLTNFIDATTYQPRFGFRRRAIASGRAIMVARMNQRIAEAIQTAR